MSLLHLPPELFDAIVDNIRGSKQALHAASLTCHVLHDHANPRLYSEVNISEYRNDQLFRFAETMLNNPPLASFVKYFSGPLYPTPSLSKAFEPLKGWLQRIVNLKTLRLAIIHDLLQNPYPKCPFNLESLTVTCKSSFLSLKPFLESQPDLIFLGLWLRSIEPRVLSPRVCPKLKVLCGNLYTARTLLPGRRVARFEWTLESVPPSPILISEIRDELNNLRSLSYKGFTVPCAHLHSLRFLEVQRMDSKSWVFISTLPCLRILLVSEDSYSNSMLRKPDQILELLELFSKIQTLQCVDVVGSIDRVFLSCSRWLRGAEEPITVPLRVAAKGRTMFLDDGEEVV